MITITKKEYDDLVRSQYLLECLEDAGVDNWKWYGDAYREFYKKYGDDDE